MEEYTQLTLDDWLAMKESLKQDLIGVQESFVRIGYILRTIEEQELYKRDGYETITEFAKAEYGLSASTISRFININRKFSVAGYSDRLRPEFAQIGSSKLSEMLSMPDSDLEMVRPELPKEDIRELKRFNKAEPEPEKADSLEKLVLKFLETNREIAKELEESEAYAAGEVEKMAEIVNPSGTKTFRMGLFFMAMYENDIQIKQFGQTPRKMSWAEFFQIARKILESQEWQAEEVEGTEEREEAQKSRESVEQERKQEKASEGMNEIRGEEKAPGKPSENRIAPAQLKTPEKPVNTEAEPVLETKKNERKEAGTEETVSKAETGIPEATEGDMEQLPGQMNMPEDYPGTESIEVVGKAMPRKDYFDTLTAWGLSVYLSKYLPADVLTDQKRLYQWIQKPVDERGYEF
ncbi:hypothetical protein [Blautia sp. OF03-13]|jgi:hypothetical protein|uniref:Uncharacterized protein n=1 Tax=Myoviridae sp. ct5Tq8 TaxID=2826612 RepID=A0A8S5NE47_9CAUD|nr:hypothetical protein [Blautia sp. OF03-13]RGF81796.1 hypothetical protein DXA55_09350 [Blautia sp. OF03-13]DAD92538.1 MAG TPA: Protein of unknown function (DUF3102) [Myoviridae sp. ct5Tq8]